MRFTVTFFIFFVILISDSVTLGSYIVTLYPQKRFRGEKLNFEMTPGNCYRVGTSIGSMDTRRKCIRLYVGRNCFGSSFKIGGRCGIDVRRCNVNKNIESMNVC